MEFFLYTWQFFEHVCSFNFLVPGSSQGTFMGVISILFQLSPASELDPLGVLSNAFIVIMICCLRFAEFV